MHAEGIYLFIFIFIFSFYCCLYLKGNHMQNKTAVSEERYDNCVNGFYSETEINELINMVKDLGMALWFLYFEANGGVVLINV